MNFTLASSSDCHYHPIIPPSLGNATERELSAYRIPVIVPDNTHKKKLSKKCHYPINERQRLLSDAVSSQASDTQLSRIHCDKGRKAPEKERKGQTTSAFSFHAKSSLDVKPAVARQGLFDRLPSSPSYSRSCLSFSSHF